MTSAFCLNHTRHVFADAPSVRFNRWLGRWHSWHILSGSRISPNQLLASSYREEVRTSTVTASSESTVRMTHDRSLRIVEHSELVTTLWWNVVHCLSFELIPPYGLRWIAYRFTRIFEYELCNPRWVLIRRSRLGTASYSNDDNYCQDEADSHEDLLSMKPAA